MEAVVSDILRARKQEPAGLRKTAAISVAVHVVFFALLAVLPSVLPSGQAPRRVVMTISLGGAPGPSTGGTQMIGGRTIEAAQPSAVPQPVRNIPPSVTPPKMALPDPKQKPRTPPKPSAAAAKDPRGTVTGKGAESQRGTARVETGAKGEGFGLSSGGGGGDGGVKLGVSNFCCPDYLVDMQNRIRRNWNERQQRAGAVVMMFTIQRNGQITNIAVERSSQDPVLDLAAQRALINTRVLAPLPAAFPERELPVYLTFVYSRD